MSTALALDGPLNGTYITPEQAKLNGYLLGSWTTGEECYVHEKSPLSEEEAFPETQDEGDNTT